MDYIEPTGHKLSQSEWDNLPPLMDQVFIGLADADAPFKAKIRFTGIGAAHIRERVYSYDQTISADKDRSIIWEGICQSEMEVIRWVLSCGHDAELLSPECLRQKVVKLLKASTMIYENGVDDEKSSKHVDSRMPQAGG